MLRLGRERGARGGLGRSRLRTSLASLLLELAADPITLERGEIVDEQLAVEVIHFVLQANGQNAVELTLEDDAVTILRPHTDALRTLDRIEDAGDRQAALFHRANLAAPEDLRIDEHERLAAIVAHVHDDELPVHVDLGGGEADAGRRVHGLEHVVHQPQQGGVKHRDRLGAGAQTWIGKLENGQQSHGARSFGSRCFVWTRSISAEFHAICVAAARPAARTLARMSVLTPTDTADLCHIARASLDAHRLREALARVGTLHELLQLDERALRAIGIPSTPARRIVIDRLATERQLADLECLQRLAITPLAAHLPGYPPQLLTIADAPAVLFVRGQADCLREPQLAMVGSRHPTANGVQTARDFAAHFAGLGLTITSGLALGIDAASHAGALAAGGRTIAVCGTGLDVLYPERNAELAERITQHGALVSEFPPGTPPFPGNFPRRNRLISGLSLGVLVVEAARRSGSLATARCAGEQGREVFAIPGSIHSSQSQGCHQLLRQGATLVENAEDVLSELPKFVLDQLVEPPPKTRSAPAEGAARLDNPAEILLDALGFEPTSVDALIASTGLSSSSVASLLLTLELEGRIASDLSGRYFRCARALF